MDVIGPFVTPSIVANAFPNGLEQLDKGLSKGLRSAYESWLDSDDPVYHREFINVVLENLLGYRAKHILEDQGIPDAIRYDDRVHHTTVRPSLIIQQPEFPDRGRVLLMRLEKGEPTAKPKPGAKWQSSPISQMQMLLQATNEKVGIVTNGEEWVLVNNCGGSVGFATWYAYLWFEEHETLRSFQSLLGIRRVFGGEPGNRLADLLAKGAEDQQEVTDRLGFQVRLAVEELVGAFERLDRDSERKLLQGVSETNIYEGVLTVMMRLVFLFCAEERGLLHLGEDLYDRSYAVSTLREQLQEDASKLTEEVLDRRASAWCRLQATFRMVYQGVEHEDLRIPAYGGTLFDPDRFPWLEGRQSVGTAEPPHISDRIVLHLLDSLQVLRQGQEARRLSFRALDVEQIGHVYEGLLDHTVKRATEPVLGLIGKEGDEPEVVLSDLVALAAQGRPQLLAFLKRATSKTERTLATLLDQHPDEERVRKLRRACGDDAQLYEQTLPFANIIREDSFDVLQVYPAGSAYFTSGTDRRSTGTHYTPKSLCEEVVRYALEPLVYVGPAEGLPEEEWTLKDAKAIVDLKVCDMAMGSGAFLVAACRYLSERLVEAWAIAEEKAQRRLGFSAEGHFFLHRQKGDPPANQPGTYLTTPYGEIAVADLSQELIPSDADERLASARRIVADRCLYGVDRNAMAVEMAKLSLWLTTLRKDRPFTFLDHALRHGDSLLGVTGRQLEMFNMDTSGQSKALLLPWVPEYVEKVRNLRQQIGRIPSHDPEAIRRKQRLFDQVRELERPLKFAADALVACELSEGNARDKAARRVAIQSTLAEVPASDRFRSTLKELTGRPTFHWELEFPDVLRRDDSSATDSKGASGFDAIVGNPPFQGGSKITDALGTDYREFIVSWIGGVRGSADLCAYFLLKACILVTEGGSAGLILTSTISQGDTREVGLDQILAPSLSGTHAVTNLRSTESSRLNTSAQIYRAVKSEQWPSKTLNLEIAKIWLRKGTWSGKFILGADNVSTIGSYLESDVASVSPLQLKTNSGLSFNGYYVLGMGFVMTPEEAAALIAMNSRNQDVLMPYLNGEDINTRPDQSPSRFVINFFDWPLGRSGQKLPCSGCHVEVMIQDQDPDRWIANPVSVHSSWENLSDPSPGLIHPTKRAWLQMGIVPSDYPGPVAADYPECLEIVERLVRPERARLNREARRLRWWQYAEKAPGLVQATSELEHVLVHPLTSKYNTFARKSVGTVFSHMTIVVAVESWSEYGLLQSDLHWQWALLYGNKLETRPQYTPSDCFETFPFPLDLSELSDVGKAFYDHRRSMAQARPAGLTKIYNLMHDASCDSDDVKQLRIIQTSLDNAATRAYGWVDLDLDHGFHETPQGVRFTISPEARKEVLRRLLKLNHERYAEEVAAGLHDKKGKKSTRAKGNGRRSRGASGSRADDAVSRSEGLFDSGGRADEVGL